METSFKSHRDRLFSIIILGLCALLLCVGLVTISLVEFSIDSLITFTIIILVIGLLLWIYFGTSYQLNSQFLMYKSGPVKGKIDLNSISEIVVGKTLWVGLRPATARNGLIIKYQKFNEIYISPENKEHFINCILKLNPNISILK